MPYAIGATDLGYDNGPHLCSDLEDRPDGTENLIHTYLAGTFLTAVPLFIVLCVYLRIYIHIRLHVRKQNAWSSEPQQQQKNTAVATVSSTVQGAGSSDKESGNNKEGGGGSNADGTEGQGNSAIEKKTQVCIVIFRGYSFLYSTYPNLSYSFKRMHCDVNHSWRCGPMS